MKICILNQDFIKSLHYLHSFCSLMIFCVRSRNVSWWLGHLKVWEKVTRNCSLEAEIQSKEEVKPIISLHYWECMIWKGGQLTLTFYTFSKYLSLSTVPWGWDLCVSEIIIHSHGVFNLVEKAQIINAITKWWRWWRKQRMLTWTKADA